MRIKLIGLFLIGLFIFHLPVTTVQGQVATTHVDFVNTVDWSNSGETLASGSTDRSVKYWNGNGEYMATKLDPILGHNASVLNIEWSPDDTHLLSSSVDENVFVWNDTNTPEFVFDDHTSYVKAIDWHPNASKQVFASGAQQGNLYVGFAGDIDSEDSLYEKTILDFGSRTHTGSITDVKFSDDGSRMVTAAKDGIIKLWRFNDSDFIQEVEGSDVIEEIADIDVGEPIYGMDYSSGGNVITAITLSGVYLVTVTNDVLSRTNAGEPQLSFTCASDDCINLDIEISPNGDKIAVAYDAYVETYGLTGSTIASTSTFSLNVENTYSYEESVNVVDVSWNPDNEKLAFATAADVVVYNTATDTEVFRVSGDLPTETNVIAIALIVLVIVVLAIFIIRRQLNKTA